jgi:hypothetical protein
MKKRTTFAVDKSTGKGQDSNDLNAQQLTQTMSGTIQSQTGKKQ